MTQLDQPGDEFPVAFCSACQRQVLTYVHLDESDQPESRCVTCDGNSLEGERLATSEEIAEHGYALVEAGGCGNSDCGGGSCGR